MDHQPSSDAPFEVVKMLPTGQIFPNPLQPRRRFDPSQIQALAASIRQQGVIQPVVVRPHPQLLDSYELVAGERRWRALKLLGRAQVAAIVRPIEDQELLEVALVENLQREQLTPIEEAQAYRDLLDLHGYTQESLALKVGRERSTIANTVRLLALPSAVQNLMEEGRLTAGHARPLLALPTALLMEELAQKVVEEGLSVRETERAVKRLLEARPSPPPPPLPRGPDPYGAVLTDLERRLATKVEIDQKNHQGAITIRFYSMDDFNRLYDMLMKG